MEYLGVAVVFVASLIGITGDTWNTTGSGLRRITAQGWITVFCAAIGMGVSIYTVVGSEKAERKLNEQLVSLNAQNGLLNLQNTNLSDQNSQLIDMVEEVGIRQKEIDRWSERVPLITMMEGVRLANDKSSWISPGAVKTGSTVKLYGFDCPLILRFGSQEYLYYGDRGRDEFPVIGPSGRAVDIVLKRISGSSSVFSSGRRCSGKVQVISTDRTESTEPSYEP